jgi:hypothetical protein
MSSKASQESIQKAVVELVAFSCFDAPEDQELFILHPPILASRSIGKRQDERGYGLDVQAIIADIVQWMLEIGKSVPEDILQDGIKFWLYLEIYKRISHENEDSSKSRFLKKIQTYLEKQIK